MHAERANDGPAGLVLIHGAELGSWIWAPVLSRVQVPAHAVDLPGREASAEIRRRTRLEDAITAVADQVAEWRLEPLVLVMHSFAGVLAPGVTELLGGRVRALVWVGATVPVHGRSWLDLQPLGQRLVLRALYRLRPGGVLSPAKQNLATLCNDVEPGPAADAMAQRVPEVPGFLLDAVRRDVPPGLTSHYVCLSRDRAQSEQQRASSIARLSNVVTHDLDAGHLPMLSQPEGLARILDGIAMAHSGSVTSGPSQEQLDAGSPSDPVSCP